MMKFDESKSPYLNLYKRKIHDMIQSHSTDLNTPFKQSILAVLKANPRAFHVEVALQVGIRPECVRKLRRQFVAAGLLPEQHQ
jgi:hypothetical protein